MNYLVFRLGFLLFFIQIEILQLSRGVVRMVNLKRLVCLSSILFACGLYAGDSLEEASERYARGEIDSELLDGVIENYDLRRIALSPGLDGLVATQQDRFMQHASDVLGYDERRLGVLFPGLAFDSLSYKEQKSLLLRAMFDYQQAAREYGDFKKDFKKHVDKSIAENDLRRLFNAGSEERDDYLKSKGI